jgi:hypothetical protein
LRADRVQPLEDETAVEPEQEQADLNRERLFEKTVVHGGERIAKRQTVSRLSASDGRLECSGRDQILPPRRRHLPLDPRELGGE